MRSYKRMLLEDRRNELISKGQRGEREKGDGKTRYQKRVKSRFSTSTAEYNKIDMNALFKDNILTVRVPVVGETDNYLVTMKFGGFLDLLRNRLKKDDTEILDLKEVIRALLDAFNSDSVYIFCQCPDFKYRFQYFATVTNINAGEPQLIPSDITNPNNKLGPGCKHIMLVLANTSWLIKVASVINNYVRYIGGHRPRDYADIIYPAIYGKKYEKPVQLSLDDSDELISDEETINISNKEGRTRTQFKPGNPTRFEPKEKQNPDQLELDLENDQ